MSVRLSALLFHLSQLRGLAGHVGLGEVGKMEEAGMSGAWECGTWRVEIQVGCLVRPSTPGTLGFPREVGDWHGVHEPCCHFYLAFQDENRR